jgi:hypothetical protein
MLSKDELERAKEQMKEMFGPPPLVRGESEELYWKWWEALVEEHEPKGFSALVQVTDLANKQWEQNRLRRSSSALIERGLRGALANLLRPFNATGLADIHIPGQIAYDYYFGDVDEKREARENVTRCGITEDQITAEAMQMRSRELIAIDRMDSYRVSSRRGC